MAELEEARDDFISASMATVPWGLSRRLVLQLPTRQRNKATRRSKRVIPRRWAVHRSRETQRFTTVQKTFLLTVSGLNAASVPEHQEIVNLALQSFVEAGYPASVYLTHMAVFREPHQDGGMHFHIATAFSEPFRWIGWKIPCRAMVKSSTFPTWPLTTILVTGRCSMLTCCATCGCRRRRSL